MARKYYISTHHIIIIELVNKYHKHLDLHCSVTLVSDPSQSLLRWLASETVQVIYQTIDHHYRTTGAHVRTYSITGDSELEARESVSECLG